MRALERHRFNRTAAGASLGLSLRQMRYRMARLGVNVADHAASGTADGPPSSPGEAFRDAWHDGWWSQARRVRVAELRTRDPIGALVTLAVIHSISLPPGEYGGDAIERLFTNRLDWDAHPYFEKHSRPARVGALPHAARRRAAAVRVLRPARLACRAAHRGAAATNCNDYSVGIELEGLEGETFEAAQYAHACARVARALPQRYPVTEAVGHEHMAPGRKSDPGPGLRLAGCCSGCWPVHAIALPHAIGVSTQLRVGDATGRSAARGNARKPRLCDTLQVVFNVARDPQI